MSKQDRLKVALLQICSSDHLETNQKKILSKLQCLENPIDLDLVVLPENSLFIKVATNSPQVGIKNSDPIYQPFIKWCQETKTHLIFGSNPLAVEGKSKVKNATIWINPSGEVAAPYSKIHLFDVDVEGQAPVRESDYFLAGGEPSIIGIKGWKLGLSICYDMRFSELYLQYAENGVDALMIPAAFLVSTGKAHWNTLVRARAIESQCFVLAPAQAGTHQSQLTDGIRKSYGHSLVVGPWGEVLGALKGEESGVLVVELNRSDCDQARKQIPVSQHRTL